MTVELRWLVRETEITIVDSIFGDEVGTKYMRPERVLQWRTKALDPSRSPDLSWSEWRDVPEAPA